MFRRSSVGIRVGITLAVFRRGCSLPAHSVLSLPTSASKAAIKLRYLELAKETHPDANPDAPEGAFLAVQTAFEELMAAPTVTSSGSSSSSRARGGGPPVRRAGAQPRPATARAPTLGEILCSRLEDDPSAYRAVWDDILGERLEVTATMTCTIFKACAKSGDGMSAALAIFVEAQQREVMTPAVRATSIASALTFCKEEVTTEATYAFVDMITDEDRTSEVLDALSSTFSYFPSGASF